MLFQVKLWEVGKDRSFVEKSKFVKTAEGWRYLDGDLLPVSRVKGDPQALRLATFALPQQ